MTNVNSPRALRAGILGYGSVGRGLGELIRAGVAGSVEVVGVLVREPSRYADEATRTGWTFVDSAEALLALRPTVVAEAAGHAGLRQHVPTLLRGGVEVLCISVGALGDPELLDSLLEAAAEGQSRLRVVSGAIAGLDAISAAATIGLDEVTHTIRKPPTSLLSVEEAAQVKASGEPRVLYRGPAREAARLFPENVNVAAAVSLAGIGLDRTIAQVVADPSVTRNTHEVSAKGAFGQLDIRMQNIPSENPKTGRIVAPSLARVLRSYSEPLVVGA
ncbi:MAG: aspartate dehydrogenase [Chloroflexi bacterium]|nr:aspartate dehydrogenase [Chloroflexota bacterium]